jgi:hypothetical protein
MMEQSRDADADNDNRSDQQREEERRGFKRGKQMNRMVHLPNSNFQSRQTYLLFVNSLDSCFTYSENAEISFCPSFGGDCPCGTTMADQPAAEEQ